MRKITLLGELGKRFGRTHKFDVNTPAEAIRALCANFPGFEKFLASSHQMGLAYKIKPGKTEISKEELHYPIGKSDLKIIPVIMGSGAAGRIIFGAVLLAASFLPIPGAQFLGTVGLSLVLGGVCQLLTPTPKSDTDTGGSKTLGGPQNVSSQGVPIPICYGRVIIGSALISAGITVSEQASSVGVVLVDI